MSVEPLAAATQVAALSSAVGFAAGPGGAAAQVPRRTVVITGHGHHQPASRRGYEARLKPHERSSFKPDRVALWAVLLGLALLLGAVTSSHAATLNAAAMHVAAAHVVAADPSSHAATYHAASVHPASVRGAAVVHRFAHPATIATDPDRRFR